MTDSPEATEAQLGYLALDATGRPLGRLVVLYRDGAIQRPAFGAVAMIRRGRRRAVFVPLAGARTDVGKETVTLRCGRELARRAPSAQAGRDLPAEHEPDLFRHYDLDYEPTPLGNRRLARLPART